MLTPTWQQKGGGKAGAGLPSFLRQETGVRRGRERGGDRAEGGTRKDVFHLLRATTSGQAGNRNRVLRSLKTNGHDDTVVRPGSTAIGQEERKEGCVKPGDRERGVEREAKTSVHIDAEVKRERGDHSHTGTHAHPTQNRKARQPTGTKDRPGRALLCRKGSVERACSDSYLQKARKEGQTACELRRGRDAQTSPRNRGHGPATPAWALGEGPAIFLQGPSLTVTIEAVLGTSHAGPRHEGPQEWGASAGTGTGWWEAQLGSGPCFNANRKWWMLPSVSSGGENRMSLHPARPSAQSAQQARVSCSDHLG